MSHSVTGEVLVARARERVSHAGTTITSTAETLNYVNAALARWWHFLCAEVDGYGYTVVRTSDMTFDDVTSVVVAPGVWRPAYVSAASSTSFASSWELRRIEHEDTVRAYQYTGGRPEYYVLGASPTAGLALRIFPVTTPSSYEWEVGGIAPPPVLAGPSASVELVSSLAEDLVVTYAAMDLRDREDVPVGALAGKADRLEQIMIQSMHPRDVGQPRRVRADRDDIGADIFAGGWPWRLRP